MGYCGNCGQGHDWWETECEVCGEALNDPDIEDVNDMYGDLNPASLYPAEEGA